jgi:hypothetical protein
MIVEARYTLGDYPSPGPVWATLLTDRAYAAPTFDHNRTLTEHTITYAYEFADDQAPPLGFEFPPALPGGAFHGADMSYLFDDAGEDGAGAAVAPAATLVGPDRSLLGQHRAHRGPERPRPASGSDLGPTARAGVPTVVTAAMEGPAVACDNVERAPAERRARRNRSLNADRTCSPRTPPPADR